MKIEKYNWELEYNLPQFCGILRGVNKPPFLINKTDITSLHSKKI